MKREDLTGYWQAKDRGCREARAYLIHRYRCLVPATRQKRLSGAPERFWEDMEAEGYLMLVRCVDDFDRSRGVQFPTYAITKIWGAMTELLRREDWTPRSQREKERAGDPSAIIHQVVSLEYTLAEEPAEIDRLADTKAPVEAQVISRIERQMIRGLVHCLARHERTIIFGYYWEEEPLDRLAVQLERSDSRVDQWKREALHRLRGWLERTEAFHAGSV